MLGMAQLWNSLVILLVLECILRCRCDGQGRSSGDGRFLGGFFPQTIRQSRSPDDRSRSLRDILKGCGQTIKADNGYFKSPGFPTSYGPNLLCEWILQVPAGKQILIRFVMLDVRGGDNGQCMPGEDYLMIRDSTRSGRHLGIFCSPSSESSPPSPILSITNQVWVIFHSNRSLEGKGFLISFTSLDSLDYSDFIADQVTFRPSTDEPSNMSSLSVNTQESESTVSSSQISSQLPTQIARGETAMVGQDNEHMTTDSRNKDMRKFEFIAVNYSNPDGFSVTDQSFSPLLDFELRLQTVTELTLPNPTEKELLPAAIQVDDSSQLVINKKLNFTTVLGLLHSQSQTEDELQTVQPQISTDDIFTKPQSMRKRQTRTEIFTKQQLEMQTEQYAATHTEQQVLIPTGQQAAIPTGQQAESVAPRHLDIQTEQQPVIQTELQAVNHTEQNAVNHTEQKSVTQSEQPGESASQQSKIQTEQANIQTELQAVSESEQQGESVSQLKAQTEQQTVMQTKQAVNHTEQKAFTQNEQQAERVTQQLEIKTEQQALSPTEQQALSPTEQQALSPAEQQALSPTEHQALSPTEQQALSPTEQQALSPTEQQALSPTEQQALSPTEQQALSPTEQQALSPTEQQALSPTEQQALSPTEQQALSPTEQQALSPTEQQALSPTEQQALSPTEQQALSPTEQQALSPTEQQALSPTEQQALSPTEQQALSPTEQQALSPTEQQALSPTEQQALSPTEQQALSPTEQQALSPTEQQALSPTEQQALSPTEQQALSPTEQQALSPTEQQALSPTEQQALSPTEQQALSSTEQQALSSTEQQALSSTEQQALSSTEQQALSSTEQQALSSTEQQALSSTEQQALSSTEQQALSSTEQQALSSTEQQALSSTEQQALSSTEQQALSSTEQQALSSTEQQALSSTEQQALSSTEHQALTNTVTVTHTVSQQQLETQTEQQAVTPSEWRPERVTQNQLKTQTEQVVTQTIQQDVTQTEQQDATPTKQQALTQAESATQLQLETQTKKDALFQTETKADSFTEKQLLNGTQLPKSQTRQHKEPPTLYSHTSEQRNVDLDGLGHLFGEAVSKVIILLTNISITDERSINETCNELNSTMNETLADFVSLSNLSQNLEYIYARFFLEAAMLDNDMGSGFVHQSKEAGLDSSSLLPFVFLQAFLSEAGKLFNATLEASIHIEPFIAEASCMREYSQLLLKALQNDKNVTSSSDHVEDMLKDMFQGLVETDANISDFINQPKSLYPPWNEFEVSEASRTEYPFCDNALIAEAGIVVSPNFPLPYPPSTMCFWVIYAPQSEHIALKFLSFDLEASLDCEAAGDFLEIINPVEMYAESWINTTYCAAHPPSTVVSITSTIGLKFVSDDSGTNRGFSAIYRHIHGDLSENPEDIDFPSDLLAEVRSQINDERLEFTSEPWDFSSYLDYPSGELQSPNYPGAYPVGVRYRWNITVSMRGVISLHFTHFDLDSSSSEDIQCDERYAHVKVDDENNNGMLVKHVFCGQEIPPAIVSSSNTLIITFISGYGYGTGFHAQYIMQKLEDRVAIPDVLKPEAICGGSRNEPSGVIQSPNFPGDFEMGVGCQWNITVDVGQIIVLNFTDFDLDSIPIDNWCNEGYAHVKIVDGNGVNNHTYCGQEIPPIFISSTNTIIFTFASVYGYSGGFRAHYIGIQMDDSKRLTEPRIRTSPPQSASPSLASEPSIPCGGNLNDPKGAIQAPEYPRVYSTGVHCRWNITVDAGSVIALNFTIFDLDSFLVDNLCDERYTHVEVVDGGSSRYVFCGQVKPPMIISSTRTLIIDFFGAYGIGSRFHANYASKGKDDGLVDPRLVTATSSKFTPTSESLATDELFFRCGGFLTTPTGEIQSPRQSGEQPRSFLCKWNITVDNQWIILVNFTDFHLDSISMNDDHCDKRYDHVRVVDGNDNDAGSEHVFCGQESPGIFISSTNTLTIEFVTSGYAGGFSSHYNSMKPERSFISPIPTMLVNAPTTTSSPSSPTALPNKCGGNFNSPEGEIQSPDYFKEFISSVTCTWNITLEAGLTIALKFKVFRLDSMPVGDHCDTRYAHVSVVNGRNEETSPKFVYCGEDLPEVFLSSTNTLIVAFVSGYGYGGEFYAHYTSSKADGDSIDPKLITVSSGSSETPVSVQSLVTDKLMYSCGGNLNSPNGIIQSPSFAAAMQSQSLDCRWTITVQVDMVIALDFIYFDLDSVPVKNMCDDRYTNVKVIDGGTDASPSQVFCGQELPPRFVSSSNDLIVIYIDLYGYSGGFHAQYTMVSSSSIVTTKKNISVLPTLARRLLTRVKTEQSPSCGNVLSGISGMFSTPEYPNLYPANTFCSWNISTADRSRFVALRFVDFDVDSPMLQQNCTVQYSYVRVSYHNEDGIEESCLLCGSKLPETIAVRSHQVTVDFYSNLGIGRGFQAAYQMYEPTEDGSGTDWPPFRLGPDIDATTPSLTVTSSEIVIGASVLTAQTGIINSPNYPAQFPRDSHNVWIIRPDHGTFISLVFDDIDFDVLTDDENDGSCNTLYTHLVITVYSMDSRSSKVIVCQNGSTTNVFSYGELKLEFHSAYGMGRGFKARYSSGFRIGDGGGNGESQEIPTPTPPYASLPLTSREAITQLNSTKERFSEWCQYMLLESRGKFSSPNYPSVYPENIVCQWTMLASAGQLVRLDFSRFHLDSEDSSPCDTKYSHIVITTSDPSGDEEYMYCGKVIPPGIVSPSNKLVVIFRSQFGLETGFLAEYQFIDEDAYRDSFGPITVAVQSVSVAKEHVDIETTKPPRFPEVERTIPRWKDGPDYMTCDQLLTDPDGVISSTNFPHGMVPEEVCAWTILIPGNQGIYLNFLDFDLQGEGESSTCSRESATVSIAMDSNIYDFCGNTLPPPISSSDNLVIVVFRSEFGKGTGFRLQYTDASLISTDSAQPHAPRGTESGTDLNTQKSGSTVLVPEVSDDSRISSSSTVLNASASVMDQTGIDIQFLGEDGITNQPDEGKRDFTEPAIERVSVPVYQPHELETSTPHADLETEVMATTQSVLVSEVSEDNRISSSSTILNASASVIDQSGIDNRFLGEDGITDQPDEGKRDFTEPGLERVSVPVYQLQEPETSTPHADLETEVLATTQSVLVSKVSEDSRISSSSTVLNASASMMDQTEIDIRFLGEDGITDQPDEGNRDITEPGRERVSVPVSQPQEPETSTPHADLKTELMATTQLEVTINVPCIITLPEYTNLPEVTDNGRNDSRQVDIFSSRRLQITVYVCISVAVILFVVLVILTAVCVYKRRRRHISKSIDMGRTERSYWQNYKSWARDYTGGPGSTMAQVVEEGEEAENMLKQERLV